MSKVFIALGAKEYRKLFDKDVILVDLEWNYHTFTDWVNEALKKVPENVDVIMGHSIGAAVALVIAKQKGIKETHLYSPSPVFTNNIGMLEDSHLKFFGKRRQNDVWDMPKINGVHVYVGSEEDEIMKKSSKFIKGKHHVVEGANHVNLVEKIMKK